MFHEFCLLITCIVLIQSGRVLITVLYMILLQCTQSDNILGNAFCDICFGEEFILE